MITTKKLIQLLGYFHRNIGKEIDSYDAYLQEMLGIGQKQLFRELEALESEFEQIVMLKNGRRKVFKLIEPIEILKEAYSNDISLGMLFEMARDSMPELIEEWDQIGRKEQKPYKFFNMPYEDIRELEQNDNFKSLKDAINRREYRDIYLQGGKRFKDVKPIKFIFSDGNWYISYVDKDELRLSRISFIKKVTYSKKSESYQPSTVKKYLEWIDNDFQNSFSRYALPSQTATLIAAPNIAHYFDKGMKRFFKSQRFVRKEEDGSVVFEIDYTQPMEILPFVRRWLPDLKILQPSKLQIEHTKILQRSLM